VVSSNHLNPGEKGQILVKVDTAGRRGMFTKTVEVTSNDPRKIKTVLMLRANVKETLP